MSTILEYSSKLIASIGNSDFYYHLHNFISSPVEVNRAKIFLFQKDRSPVLLGEKNLSYLDSLYCQSLYKLDPAYETIMKESSDTALTLKIQKSQEEKEKQYYEKFYKHLKWPRETILAILLDEEKFVCISIYTEYHTLKITPYLSIAKESILKHENFSSQNSQIKDISYINLTNREADILNHILNGKNPKQISRALNISDGTVRNHKKSIYKKLNVHNLNQLYSLFK